MPEATLTTAVLFGLVLGMKHALDADHIVAVTTIVSRSRSLLRSALVGLSWGIGHTFTLFTVGFGVLILKLNIPDKMALWMELLVGIILVLLGVSVLRQVAITRGHAHEHVHGDKSHAHPHSHTQTEEHSHRHLGKSLLVGMVHGLAGSGALTVLVLGAMPSTGEGLLFLLLFGIGSIVGMMFFSGIIGLPFRFSARISEKLNMRIQQAAGIISICLGIFVVWQMGFAGGLFSI
jgi:sulfite exporter TauE/SafE